MTGPPFFVGLPNDSPRSKIFHGGFSRESRCAIIRTKREQFVVDLISPAHASDFLLAESRERGEVLTNLKLQKLLFYGQAWYLALKGRELFAENFQAWVHGPVLPSQYRRFRDFQWKPLTVDVARPQPPEDVANHLVEIVDVFGSENAVALELMTHREDPWRDARGDLPPDRPSTARIDKEAMRAFYRSLADA